jgi:hypothetical protein
MGEAAQPLPSCVVLDDKEYVVGQAMALAASPTFVASLAPAVVVGELVTIGVVGENRFVGWKEVEAPPETPAPPKPKRQRRGAMMPPPQPPPLEEPQTTATPATLPAASPAVHPVAVESPPEMPQLGSFGDLCIYYQRAQKMATPVMLDLEDVDGRRAEMDLVHTRAAGYLERMTAIHDDHVQRGLRISMVPPDVSGPSYAVYKLMYEQERGNLMQPKNVYMFARDLMLLRAPDGRMLLTVDSNVAAVFEEHGCERVAFEEVRDADEAHARLAAITERRDQELQQQQQQQLLEEQRRDEAAAAAAAAAESEPQVRIPAALSKSFRGDLVGNGNNGAFFPLLAASMFGAFKWNGVEYDAIATWTRDAMRCAWQQAEPKDVQAWEQTVLELKQVCDFLCRVEKKEGVWVGEHAEATQTKVGKGSASFTAVRKAARAFSASAGGSSGLDWPARVRQLYDARAAACDGDGGAMAGASGDAIADGDAPLDIHTVDEA